MELTHLDENGKARMVDVSEKSVTERTAEAYARLKMKEEKAGDFPPSERMRELVIAGLYDKARYTAHPVTDEDLKTMEESV